MFKDVLELAPIDKAPPSAPTLVDAPAICEQCKTVFYSPTTGRAKSPCFCGGRLRTVPYPIETAQPNEEPKMVRAKFILRDITSHSWSKDARTLVFSPQYDSSIEEDRRFAKSSPSGEFRIQVDNPAALEQLKLGDAYYFDITPAATA
jgi:hypothetical protein